MEKEIQHLKKDKELLAAKLKDASDKVIQLKTDKDILMTAVHTLEWENGQLYSAENILQNEVERYRKALEHISNLAMDPTGVIIACEDALTPQKES